jgi:putative membrane protein
MLKKASDLFSEKDKQQIAEAIAEAEKKTTGEIVPVVATASGRYDRAEDLFGVLCALITLALAWVLFQDVKPISGGWQSGQTLVLGLLPVLIIVLVSFLIGATAATYFPALRLPFILKGEMQNEVEHGAAEAFHRFRLRETDGATGILIYISLYEHRVRILGDSAITEKLNQADWDEICKLVVEGLHKGQLAGGLCQAIEKTGELLAQHFPIKEGVTNELINEIQFVE